VSPDAAARVSSARAVALLSGGIDSATAAAIVRDEGVDVFPLTVRYGQRHAAEIDAARRVASALRLREPRVVDVDLRAIGGSALTSEIAVPKEPSRGIPPTYVPARNTILLALALGYAETVGAFDLVIGANAVDYSGYPDCRGPFLEAFERVARLATRAGAEGLGGFRVRAPLLAMTKAEIVSAAASRGVPLELTVSCYDPTPEGLACGACDSCRIRRRGFEEAGRTDPTRYRVGA
jgi:7-cyano-7-deazaguanine synthase